MYVSRKQLEAHQEPIGEVSRPSKLDRRCFGGGKKKTPKAPDYTMLANQQAAAQEKLNRQTTMANRVNQTNPFGSVTYTQDPNNQDKWSSETNFSPELQGIFNNQIGAQGQAYTGLQDYLKNIQDISKNTVIPSATINPGQIAQDAIMARLNPQLTRNEDALRARLANQGISPGTQAWNNEFTNFNQGRNDAYSQAALQGIGLDRAARQDALLERQNLLAEQSLPLNAIQAYINGNSVQMPQFANYNTQANSSSPDLLGAGQAGYQGALNSANAANASQSNFMSGLMGLGGYALGGPIGGMAGGFLGGMF
jgi:hypothetical protein